MIDKENAKNYNLLREFVRKIPDFPIPISRVPTIREEIQFSQYDKMIFLIICSFVDSFLDNKLLYNNLLTVLRADHKADDYEYKKIKVNFLDKFSQKIIKEMEKMKLHCGSPRARNIFDGLLEAEFCHFVFYPKDINDKKIQIFISQKKQ